MRKSKQMVLGTALALSMALSSSPALAKEVANSKASCIGIGISDHATAGEMPETIMHIKEIASAMGFPNLGGAVSTFAKVHAGSHAACEAAPR